MEGLGYCLFESVIDMGLQNDFLSRLSVYLITNRYALPPGKDLIDTLEEALKGGVRAVQLREKDLSSKELFELARRVRDLTAHYNALLFINDRMDVAMAVGADGVHLGGHSMPVGVVREMVGRNLLIGASTHSIEELDVARAGGADFVTFGPVYYTPSKAPYGDPVGVEALREACRHSDGFPVLGLGGIVQDRVEEVISAGAKGVGVISAIISAANPRSAAESFLKRIYG